MHAKHNTPAMQYKDAGVDIAAGNALVDRIKPLAKATTRAGVMGSLGGFGGLFDLNACGYQDPVLVAGTDGVGTKLRVALEAGIHNTVGIDLVAMCVNDLAVQGAQPLFFLDYFATGQLDIEVAETVIASIAEGCKQASCALLGGETAEMPGMYAGNDYDLAGFAVGAVERSQLLPRLDIQEGDVILGFASSGVHSNGFSLVRHIVEHKILHYDQPAPWDESQTLGEALLTPTVIYVDACQTAMRIGAVKAFSHITGGGLTENLPRILPDTLSAKIQLGSWQRPAVFDWLEKAGNITPEEMLRTFNCGIGMCVVVAEKDKDAVMSACNDAEHTLWEIGVIAPRAGEAMVYAT